MTALQFFKEKCLKLVELYIYINEIFSNIYSKSYTESFSPGNPEEALWCFHTHSIKGLLILKSRAFFGNIGLRALSDIGSDHLCL